MGVHTWLPKLSLDEVCLTSESLNDGGGVIYFGEELDVIVSCKTINDW